MGLTITEYGGDDAADWIAQMTGSRPAEMADTDAANTDAAIEKTIADARAEPGSVLSRHAPWCVEVVLDDAERAGAVGARQVRDTAARILVDDPSTCMCRPVR